MGKPNLLIHNDVKKSSTLDSTIDNATSTQDSTIDNAAITQDSTIDNATSTQDSTIDNAISTQDSTIDNAISTQDSTIDNAATKQPFAWLKRTMTASLGNDVLDEIKELLDDSSDNVGNISQFIKWLLNENASTKRTLATANKNLFAAVKEMTSQKETIEALEKTSKEMITHQKKEIEALELEISQLQIKYNADTFPAKKRSGVWAFINNSKC